MIVKISFLERLSLGSFLFWKRFRAYSISGNVVLEVTFGGSFAFSGSVTSENFYRDKIKEERLVALSKFGNVKQKNFLVCPWCHHFLKSKTREPSKLSSSGMRGGKSMSVNNFSAQQHVLSKNRHSYGGAWHKVMKVFVDKDILILGFLAFLEVKVLGKVCFYKMFSSSVQIISSLHSQGKFQMFELFSACHVCVIGGSLTWRLHTGLCKFVQIISTNIWNRVNVHT